MPAMLRHGPHAAFTLGRMDNATAAARIRRRSDKAAINAASERLRLRFVRYVDTMKSVAEAIHELGVGVSAACASSWAAAIHRLPEKYHLAMHNALAERGY